MKYFNSKAHDIEDLPDLQIDPTFSLSIEINRNTSVVHIPTDVYNGGKALAGLKTNSSQVATD